MTLKIVEETGVYYLYDYIPKRLFPSYSEEAVNVTKSIWNYKNCEINELKKYSNELLSAIIELCLDTTAEKIALVAIPPSKVNKSAAMRMTIWNICLWSQNGDIKREFSFQKPFLDFSKLLMRNESVPASHEGRRIGAEEQSETISCCAKKLDDDLLYVLLDDVTTTGTIMGVSEEKLITSGVSEDHIIKLALAKTVT